MRRPALVFLANETEASLLADTALVAILRDGRVIVPSSDDPLECGDELLFVTSQDVEAELARLLHAGA